MIVETAMYFRCALEPPGSRTHGWSWTVFIPWFRYLKCGRWVALALTWWVEVVRDASSPFIAHLTQDNSGGVPGRGCREAICGVGTLWNAMDDTRGRGCRSWKLAKRMPRRPGPATRLTLSTMIESPCSTDPGVPSRSGYFVDEPAFRCAHWAAPSRAWHCARAKIRHWSRFSGETPGAAATLPV